MPEDPAPGAYRTIVVGTDGSETSHRAVATAAEMAKATGAELVVVSAYQRSQTADAGIALDPTGDWSGTSAAGAEQIVREAREVAARIGARNRGRSEPGDRPAATLLDAAEDVDADLIVVGNQGMTRTRRFFLGSVPDHVAHHANCDVLIAVTG